MIYGTSSAVRFSRSHGSNINEPTPVDRKRANHKGEVSYGFHSAP